MSNSCDNLPLRDLNKIEESDIKYNQIDQSKVPKEPIEQLTIGISKGNLQPLNLLIPKKDYLQTSEPAQEIIERIESEKTKLNKKKRASKSKIEKNALSSYIARSIHMGNAILNNFQDDDLDKIFNRDDLLKLINLIEKNIPENDIFSYKIRLNNLNWDKVAFKCYTGENCKKAWALLKKNQRKFRSLHEILQDTKQWVLSADLKVLERFPDFPKQPFNSYLIFYHDAKDGVLQEYPWLTPEDLSKTIEEAFRLLSPAELLEYEDDAEKLLKKYIADVKDFYYNHPEIESYLMSNFIYTETKELDDEDFNSSTIGNYEDIINTKNNSSPLITHYHKEFINSNENLLINNNEPLNLSTKKADSLNDSGDKLTEETETDESTEDESFEDIFMPKTWGTMNDIERTIYIKSIIKLKECFDKQHENAENSLGSELKNMLNTIGNEKKQDPENEN